MYIIDDAIKQNPILRWNSPDRVFFAAGACHILAYAFLEKYESYEYEAILINPKKDLEEIILSLRKTIQHLTIMASLLLKRL